MSLENLSALFPVVGLFSSFFDEDIKKYSRLGAIGGIVKQVFLLLVAVSIFRLMISLSIKLKHFIQIDAIANTIQYVVSALFGLPLMMVIIVTSSNAFDLFYYFLTGSDFDKEGGELKPLKSIMLVLVFVGCFAASGFGYYYYSRYQSKLESAAEIKGEVEECLSRLIESRTVWNKSYMKHLMRLQAFREQTFQKSILKNISCEE